MKTVTSDDQAARLAARLNGSDRDRPIVVVSTPSGRREPWVEAKEIEDQLAGLAEVYLIPTGPHSWAFSRRMPAGTQVYGGAGRVYPVGHDWVGDLRKSPLRFAYNDGEGEHATKLLIDDALGMAAEAGLLESRPSASRVYRDGIVKGLVADRALIELDGGLAHVRPALAFHGIPIERLFTKGMPVTGWWDPHTRWFDVRDSRRDPAEALADYAPGDVVLAVVHEVGPNSASMFLHPLVEVTVSRSDITSNTLDDLRDLMSPAEVLPARVLAAGPDWRLSLRDVDDDVQPCPAVAIFDGGPPWLVLPTPEEDDDVARTSPSPVFTLRAPRLAEAELAVEQSLAAIEESLAAASPAPTPAATTGTPGPSPRMLDPNRRNQSPATSPDAATPTHGRGVAVATMSLTISTLKSQLAHLREELAPMRARLPSLEQENTALAAEISRLRDSVRHHELQLRHARARLRNASKHKTNQHPATPPPTPAFADPEQGFRYAVLTAWAQRTPPSEQSARPLPDFAIGPRFLPSLQALEGVSAEKVADVVFEILTDRAKDLDGRDLHPLRESEAGGSPQRARADGALAWRAALQRNTPAARRLHYWRRPDGSIELSRIVLHDDVDP